MSLRQRIGQVGYYLQADREGPPEIPPDAAERLTPAMLAQFRILTSGDQRHLLRVYRYLQAHGADDDVLTAGLIHDVGKGCATCRRMTVVERCAHVFLNRFLHGPYHAWAATADPTNQRLRNLQRLATHAERGARAANQEHYPDRVVELIRWHERGGDDTDPDLRLLREADDTADATYDTGPA